MAIVAAVLICVGLVAFMYGVVRKVKAGRLADAPLVSTGDAGARGPQVADPKGNISAQGRILCQQPLTSPVSGKPCLYYFLEVTAEWKEGDVEKTKVIDKQSVAAQFALDDGSGPVWIDATKGGVNDDAVSTSMSKSGGLLKGITGGAIEFGSYHVQATLGTKYSVREIIWPMSESGSLYACGKSVGNTIAEPGWRSLIVSNKSRDELLASVSKTAKMSLIGGGASTGVGAIAAILAATVFAEPVRENAVAPAPVTSTNSATLEIPAPSDSPSTNVEDLPVAKPRMFPAAKPKKK
jgi:hypothetical protein